jgi:NADH-quinone oxidoreductase subunit J
MSAETMIGNAFFWVCALASLLGALATIAAKNPIRNAMGLLLTIAGIAGLFLALHAQFLAAIQLIVYAGAVVILFVFVIMLLGTDATPPKDSRAAFSRIAGATGAVAVAVALTGLLLKTNEAPHFMPTAHGELGTIDAVGREIFTTGLVPFELVTALFIVAVVGAIAVARGKQAHEMTSGGPKHEMTSGGPKHEMTSGGPKHEMTSGSSEPGAPAEGDKA